MCGVVNILNNKRETLVILYTGFKLHVDDRKITEVRDFPQIGIFVSAPRLMEIRTDIAGAVTKKLEEDEFLCLLMYNETYLSQELMIIWIRLTFMAKLIRQKIILEQTPNPLILQP